MFNRRTTLTRHQNHHTGTISEAAAATAAALATRRSSSKSFVPPLQTSNSSPSREEKLESVSQSYTTANSSLKSSVHEGQNFSNDIEKRPSSAWRSDNQIQVLQTATPRPTPITTPTIPPTLVAGTAALYISRPSSSGKFLPDLPSLATSIQPRSLSPKYASVSPLVSTTPISAGSQGMMHQSWASHTNHGSPTFPQLHAISLSPRSTYR